ncbi:hypothetical protein LTR28_011415, partial [Elasticomyces elasticus]
RKRPGGRRSRELRISRKQVAQQADQLEDLVPIRLDIEFEKLKLRDTFTWNLQDRIVPLDLFSETLVEDFRLPPESSRQLAQQVHTEMQEQLQDYYPHCYIQNPPVDERHPYTAYQDDEMRILIKLDITIGTVKLVDQFEWDINNPMNSPEEFARQLARDMSLSGEFTSAIAHCIREQSQLFTRSLYITSHPFDGRPAEQMDPDLRDAFLPSPPPQLTRPQQMQKDYTPYLYELNEADIEKHELSMSREQRRQKRQLNRKGGLALPDLKDRQRTVRSLIVSSGIPGAAESVELSGIYKIRRAASGRGRRTGARPDGTEGSDESDSEGSVPDSPAPSQIMQQQGTARTRGMRGAATAAQAAMRANLGRSMTPDLAMLQQESRSSRRVAGFDAREESVIEHASLIVKLRIAPDKLRPFVQGRRSGRRSGEYPPQGHATTPLMASQTSTPQPSSTPALGSMPPPSTPGMAPRSLPPPRSSVVSTTPLAPTSTPGYEQHPQYRYDHAGRVEVSRSPLPDEPPPPHPAWLEDDLAKLRQRYPHDNFRGEMKFRIVRADTGDPVRLDPTNANANPAAVDAAEPGGANVKFQFLPRIRCTDCPDKLYTALPGSTVENFEVHLNNRHHKERVEWEWE